MVTQGLLFSEPSEAETGVWCALSDGINPSQWAKICRFIGTLKRDEFEHICGTIMPSFQTRKRLNFCSQKEAPMPLVSIGPSGIGGQFQTESY